MKSLVGPRKVLAIFLTGSLAFAAGCSEDDNDSDSPAPMMTGSANVKGQGEAQKKNLVDLVVESPDFSTLESLLIKADLVSTIQAGEFTVLAPTDAAFAKLPTEVVAALLANPEALRQVLLYHVVAGQAKAEAVLASQTLTAANGQALSVNLKDGKPYINDSAITATDILASNGVVHVIDTVLIPPGLSLEPRQALPNLVDLVVNGDSFNTLEALLIKAELVETVQKGEFTVLAPTDEAFAKLPKSAVDYLLSNPKALQDVLLYHVIAGQAKAEAVLASKTLTAANGGTLAVNLKDGKPFINNSAITATDILASNGVVHVIDTVLIPPGFGEEPRKALPNLVDLVVKGESFSTLEALLIKAELVDTVQKGEFTVFAPTDAAFAKLPKEVVDYLLSDKEALQQVLLYHVVGGTAKASKVLKSKTLETAAGASLKVSLRQGGAFINDSRILKTDVLASNGVVHVIDSVLVPPGFSLPASR